MQLPTLFCWLFTETRRNQVIRASWFCNIVILVARRYWKAYAVLPLMITKFMSRDSCPQGNPGWIQVHKKRYRYRLEKKNILVYFESSAGPTTSLKWTLLMIRGFYKVLMWIIRLSIVNHVSTSWKSDEQVVPRNAILKWSQPQHLES